MSDFALPPLIGDVLSDLQKASVLWELAVIAVALAAAWLLNRFVTPHVRTDYTALKVGAAGVQRALFPLTALIIVLAGRALLRKFQLHPAPLLDLAVPLLGALAIVRFAVFMLRHVFPHSGLVQRFERLISGVVWFGLALHITGFLPDVLGYLDEVRIPLGGRSTSLLTVINGLIAVTVTLLLALWVGRVLEQRLMSATEMDISVRVVLAKALHAVLIVLAVLIALPMVGIDLTALSVFGGALGVGLGLGLQRIASNYVSGFIILLDRSVRLGDVVTVDKSRGQIIRMNARYVVVRSLDGNEAIIPNETLISSTVVSHGAGGRRARVTLPFRIPFDSDVGKAREIALAAAQSQSRVLSEPAPLVAVTGLGDFGVELELGVSVGDPERGTAGLRTELYEAILAGLKEAGIAVPYPQSEVRLHREGTPIANPVNSTSA